LIFREPVVIVNRWLEVVKVGWF